MNLKEWREAYPEYSHVDDDEVISTFDIEIGESPDLVTPALYEIEETLEKLCETVSGITIPKYDNADVILLLKQIKNGLGSLETAIKAIDVNVTTAAPVVNIPKQTIEIPKVVLPEPLREWTFEVNRNRNGYIESITARA